MPASPRRRSERARPQIRCVAPHPLAAPRCVHLLGRLQPYAPLRQVGLGFRWERPQQGRRAVLVAFAQQLHAVQLPAAEWMSRGGWQYSGHEKTPS